MEAHRQPLDVEAQAPHQSTIGAPAPPAHRRLQWTLIGTAAALLLVGAAVFGSREPAVQKAHSATAGMVAFQAKNELARDWTDTVPLRWRLTGESLDSWELAAARDGPLNLMVLFTDPTYRAFVKQAEAMAAKSSRSHIEPGLAIGQAFAPMPLVPRVAGGLPGSRGRPFSVAAKPSAVQFAPQPGRQRSRIVMAAKDDADERAEKALNDLTKAGKDAMNALDKLNPFKKQSTELSTVKEPERETTGELISPKVREELFGKGLLGKVVTAGINSAAKSFVEAVEDVQNNLEDAYDIASRKCERDSRLADALGGGTISIGPITSTNVNSVSRNGQKADVTNLGFTASGGRFGRGIASISVTAESIKGERTNVQVVATLQTGKSFEVDGLGGGRDVETPPFGMHGVGGMGPGVDLGRLEELFDQSFAEGQRQRAAMGMPGMGMPGMGMNGMGGIPDMFEVDDMRGSASKKNWPSGRPVVGGDAIDVDAIDVDGIDTGVGPASHGQRVNMADAEVIDATVVDAKDMKRANNMKSAK